MVDPISAVAIATSAYKGLQVAITAGRELDEVATTLGKWFGAVSDFRKSEQEIKNPPLFKKMLYSGSVEQEALEIFAHTKKIAEQEQELKTLISFRYGPKAWEEMIELRRKIRAEREKTIYKQERRKVFIIDCVLVVVGISIGVAVIVGFAMWLASL